MSKFDHIYRVISLSKFFYKGWGDPHAFKRLMEFRPVVLDRDRCHSCVPSDYPVVVDKKESYSDCDILEGHFRSPFVDYVPGVVPKESETAYFQVILPKTWKSSTLRPICLHLAGTGDHYYWRRRNLLAKPLLREAGIASIILENPFWLTVHGLRKPNDQRGSNLHNVTDIFVMGGCLAFESTALFHWCERQGFGPLGVTGISMGGHMASIAACVWPKPIALIPCLSWTTASCVFTQGVMSGAINWDILEDQVFSECAYRDELKYLIGNLKDDAAFEAGKNFITHFVDRTKRAEEIQFKDSEQQQQQSKIAAASKLLKSSFTDGLSNLLSVSELINGTLISRKLGASSSDDVSSPRSSSSSKSNKSTVMSRSNSNGNSGAALQFMRGIMDEFTHLGGFSRPVDTNLIIIVAANDDAYVLRDGITDLREIWPGAEVRYVDAGHVSAFIFKQSVFRKSIIDAFERITTKYHDRQ